MVSPEALPSGEMGIVSRGTCWLAFGVATSAMLDDVERGEEGVGIGMRETRLKGGRVLLAVKRRVREGRW